MLVQNNFKENDIVSIRLSTSEEIVAKLVSETLTHINVLNPRILMIDPITGAVQAVTFMIGNEQGNVISLNKNLILTTSKSNASLASDYIKMTTGLDIPQNSGIIL